MGKKGSKLAKRLDDIPVGNYSALLDKGTSKKTTNVTETLQERYTNDSATDAEVEAKQNRDCNDSVTLPKAYLKPLQPQAKTLPETKGDSYTLMSLSKTERTAFSCIFEICSTEGSRETPPIFTDFLLNAMQCKGIQGINANYLRAILKRLKTKGCIEVTNIKNGRNPVRKIKIIDSVYTEFAKEGFSSFLSMQCTQEVTLQKPLQKPLQLGEKQAIVSSSNLNTTTNDEEDIFNNIDPSALSAEGFSKNHLIQIFNEYKRNPDNSLPDDVVQDSIDALAYDLRHNDVAKAFKNPPAVVLTGMLKKGKPYASVTPDKYKSPKDEAMQRYLEMKETQRQEKRDTEIRMQLLAYEEWLEGLPEEELLSLCPESEIPEGTPDKVKRTLRQRKAKEVSKDYFEVEIWPAKKAELQKQFEGEAEHA